MTFAIGIVLGFFASIGFLVVVLFMLLRAALRFKARAAEVKPVSE